MSTVQSPTRQSVRIERDGGCMLVALDRPPLNVLDIVLMQELLAILDELASDSAIKCVTITGAGRAFCAGVDVADHTHERAPDMLRVFHLLLLRLLRFPAPTIALVNGPALGGGCELMLACDVAIARSDAKIGQPEIKLGAFPPFAAALLPRLVGRQRALDLILSGRTISGAEAHACGLVQFAVSADQLDSFGRSYVRELSAASGPVLRLAKRAVLSAQYDGTDAAVNRCEALYLAELLNLADAKEGIAAFLEHRAPVWKEA